MRYGRAMREHWELAPDGVFLNHGSFGACPKVVLAEQTRIRREMEEQPDRFFRNRVMPGEGETELRRAASWLASFVGTGGGSLAFVDNATTAIQAVLRSIAFGPGDRILITDHTYNAVRLMVQARCVETGAAPLIVEVPIPTTADEVAARIEAALDPSVKLAILDHITSSTALVLPLERLIPILRRHGVRVAVDGAHALGQVPLDIARLEPDWYTSNAHKWLYAPKGTAFLHASSEVAPTTQPPVVSHYVARGFPESFDYVGTRDYSAWLAIEAAIAFHESLDPPAARAYRESLLAPGTELLASLGVLPVAPLEMCASMRSFILPQRRSAEPEDAARLMGMLWERERIQAHASVMGETLFTRISGQVYVEAGELEGFRDALQRHGWPGR